jgi:hypothetical protein
MSGYPDHVSHAGTRDHDIDLGAGFLPKPFTPAQLARRAKELLGAAAGN